MLKYWFQPPFKKKFPLKFKWLRAFSEPISNGLLQTLTAVREGSRFPDIVHTQIHSNTLMGPASLEWHWRGPSCTNFWFLKVLPLNSSMFLNGFEWLDHHNSFLYTAGSGMQSLSLPPCTWALSSSPPHSTRPKTIPSLSLQRTKWRRSDCLSPKSR